MPRFDFAKFLNYMQKYKITYFFSVPPIYLLIAKHPGVTNQFDTVEGAASGAAPLGAELQAAAEAKLGKGQAKLTQVWGLSETCGAITAMDPGEGEHTGSVSYLVANHEARLVDDEGKDVEPGGVGEVWVRGPVVTKGYWKNDKANQESFVGDWFCTGDVGQFKNGMLYIVDRKKVSVPLPVASSHGRLSICRPPAMKNGRMGVLRKSRPSADHFAGAYQVQGHAGRSS